MSRVFQRQVVRQRQREGARWQAEIDRRRRRERRPPTPQPAPKLRDTGADEEAVAATLRADTQGAPW